MISFISARLLVNRLGKDAPGGDIAGRIIREGDRIAEIVRGLLSFSRVQEDKKKGIRVDEILAESLTLTGVQMRKDGIIFKKRLPQDLPLITANFQQIEQVFLNVLSNARYALNQRYPSVNEDKVMEISGLEVTADDGPYVRVIFHDHGAGIPSGVIHKVLSPFYSTKPEGLGTGLGLSISYNIIKDHGGKLTLESAEGEFTRVIIDLPVHGGGLRELKNKSADSE